MHVHIYILLYTSLSSYIYTYEESWKSQEPISPLLPHIAPSRGYIIHDDVIPSEPHHQLQTTEDQDDGEATTSDQ